MARRAPRWAPLLALLASADLALAAAPAAPAGLGRLGACRAAGGWGGPGAARGALRLRGGVDPAPPPPVVVDYQSLLLSSAHAGKLDEVVEAIEGGGDPNRFCDAADNMLEPNALQYACFEGKTKVVEKLVELGADVNLANRRGYTALHFAALMGHLDTCKALVTLGANMAATDIFGDQPADRAEQADKPQVAQWLRQQMSAQGLAGTEEQREDEQTKNLIDEAERMLEDDEFIPSFMKGDDGRILPEYSQIANLVAAKKAMLGEEGQDMDFEAVQALVARAVEDVEGYDPNAAIQQEQLQQFGGQPEGGEGDEGEYGEQ